MQPLKNVKFFLANTSFTYEAIKPPWRAAKNVVRNKFCYVPSFIENNIDAAEARLNSFPEIQFLLKGMMKTYRLDVSSKTVGLLNVHLT